ncbi:MULTISPECIES: hypothetical protein [Acinetobacter]|uniref:Uncharacterized protein n=1 Tax=Acinetobacter colistiniresistens TaxID=280145 RepID=S3UEP7_9GAMM|nr:MULTISPECIES: hypothetical protein [Acinetobacter]EPG37997.1 hypothetical protein F907_01967 [Acinetobacter colistiniresistens]TVT75391.1 hypothetical protein FPV60_21545 [Acinetobacter colistiniresistens]
MAVTGALGGQTDMQVVANTLAPYVAHGIGQQYLLEELHRLVQEHTGGVWTKLILTLDENGRAHTKFIYDEKS